MITLCLVHVETKVLLPEPVRPITAMKISSFLCRGGQIPIITHYTPHTEVWVREQ